MKIRLLGLVGCAFLGGCATILSGRTQNISVDTNPSGARCEFQREGRVVAVVEKTPGAVMINKTKHDMKVVCTRQGYADSAANAHSGNEGYTLGNILLSGGIGWGFDSAVGADNKYPEQITVNLTAPVDYANAKSPKADALQALNQLKSKGLRLQRLSGRNAFFQLGRSRLRSDQAGPLETACARSIDLPKYAGKFVLNSSPAS